MYQKHHIGRIIRFYRKKKNLTIEDMADLCHMSVRGYVKIELGYSDPKWTTICKIISVLEIDPEELLVCIHFVYEQIISENFRE